MIKHIIFQSSRPPPKKKETVNSKAVQKKKIQIRYKFKYSMILINLEFKKREFILSCFWEYCLMNGPGIVTLKQ